MQIHALHVGINNYAGTENDLLGCVNDATDCARLFGRRNKGTRRDALDLCPFFPAAATQVVLLDRQAVRTRILAELQVLMKKLARGDLGIFTFSGHGTYVRDKRGGDEEDGYDEALVCYDLDVILDDELGVALERRAAGSRLLVQTDACHSGTATRSLGPRLLGATDASQRLRFMPPGRLPKHKLAGWKLARMKRTPKLVDVNHFAACRDRDFAADSAFGGRPAGAHTHFWIQSLTELDPGATYRDWTERLAEYLPSQQFDQEPQTNAYQRSLDWKIPVRK